MASTCPRCTEQALTPTRIEHGLPALGVYDVRRVRRNSANGYLTRPGPAT
ncbi:hypothetical protein [Tahibacter amnicola]|uniref:Uncharacterized protein n=1 Tax=Tahibacter amnicola TaxID=2976241 RepID=A0ABY6BII2_9GAMM|nr:hypothetical protein [Tahibacter amnicola]UXI69818.1 hypothetical protein N4264_09385 [Tahibacter amnicola]